MEIFVFLLGVILISLYATLWVMIGLKLSDMLHNEDVLASILALVGFFVFLPAAEHVFNFFKALLF